MYYAVNCTFAFLHTFSFTLLAVLQLSVYCLWLFGELTINPGISSLTAARIVGLDVVHFMFPTASFGTWLKCLVLLIDNCSFMSGIWFC